MLWACPSAMVYPSSVCQSVTFHIFNMVHQMFITTDGRHGGHLESLQFLSLPLRIVSDRAETYWKAPGQNRDFLENAKMCSQFWWSKMASHAQPSWKSYQSHHHASWTVVWLNQLNLMRRHCEVLWIRLSELLKLILFQYPRWPLFWIFF